MTCLISCIFTHIINLNQWGGLGAYQHALSGCSHWWQWWDDVLRVVGFSLNDVGFTTGINIQQRIWLKVCLKNLSRKAWQRQNMVEILSMKATQKIQSTIDAHFSLLVSSANKWCPSSFFSDSMDSMSTFHVHDKEHCEELHFGPGSSLVLP